MKQFDHIEFIDSLAKVTSHYDIDVIERSLLQILVDFSPAKEYRLYRVIGNSKSSDLALMAFAKDGVIDNLEYEVKNDKFSANMAELINKALTSQSIQISHNNSDKYNHIIYPTMDNHTNDSFAVLIQSCQEINFDNQRLIHSLLKVYSNYLELIDKTRRDKLTQLLNRETLNHEITGLLIRNNTLEQNVFKRAQYADDDARHKLNTRAFWLGMVDIDYFKKINDTYGHLYGDDVLILVARMIEKSIRDYDLAFRYGGEEFVIVLAADDLKTATYAFERMRKEIKSHTFAKVEKVTVSIGFTQIQNQDNPSEVLEEADSALYYAKGNGRDQTHSYAKLIEEHLISSTTKEVEPGDIDFF